MSDGFRPTFPRPSQTYDVNDQMNLRREIQRALDFKADKNAVSGGGGGAGYAKLDGGNTFTGPQVISADLAAAILQLVSEGGTGGNYNIVAEPSGVLTIWDNKRNTAVCHFRVDGTTMFKNDIDVVSIDKNSSVYIERNDGANGKRYAISTNELGNIGIYDVTNDRWVFVYTAADDNVQFTKKPTFPPGGWWSPNWEAATMDDVWENIVHQPCPWTNQLDYNFSRSQNVGCKQLLQGTEVGTAWIPPTEVAGWVWGDQIDIIQWQNSGYVWVSGWTGVDIQFPAGRTNKLSGRNAAASLICTDPGYNNNKGAWTAVGDWDLA